VVLERGYELYRHVGGEDKKEESVKRRRKG
jgi:hypothetical protein